MVNISKNPFNFFDAIFCINLDKRTDRWKKVLTTFKKLGIHERIERFSGIESPDGKLGITKSLGQVLKISKERSLNNVLIFEDDVDFLWKNTPLDSLKNALEQAKHLNWKLFCLGAHLIEPLHRISDNLVEFKSGYGNHAMAYHSSVFDQIINHCQNIQNISNKNDIIDVWISNSINKNSF